MIVFMLLLLLMMMMMMVMAMVVMVVLLLLLLLMLLLLTTTTMMILILFPIRDSNFIDVVVVVEKMMLLLMLMLMLMLMMIMANGDKDALPVCSSNNTSFVSAQTTLWFAGERENSLHLVFCVYCQLHTCNTFSAWFQRFRKINWIIETNSCHRLNSFGQSSLWRIINCQVLHMCADLIWNLPISTQNLVFTLYRAADFVLVDDVIQNGSLVEISRGNQDEHLQQISLPESGR